MLRSDRSESKGHFGFVSPPPALMAVPRSPPRRGSFDKAHGAPFPSLLLWRWSHGVWARGLNQSFIYHNIFMPCQAELDTFVKTLLRLLGNITGNVFSESGENSSHRWAGAHLPAPAGAFSGVIAGLADLKGLRQPNFSHLHSAMGVPRGSFQARERQRALKSHKHRL